VFCSARGNVIHRSRQRLGDRLDLTLKVIETLIRPQDPVCVVLVLGTKVLGDRISQLLGQEVSGVEVLDLVSGHGFFRSVRPAR
jgi:hypothetical protein